MGIAFPVAVDDIRLTRSSSWQAPVCGPISWLLFRGAAPHGSPLDRVPSLCRSILASYLHLLLVQGSGISRPALERAADQRGSQIVYAS